MNLGDPRGTLPIAIACRIADRFKYASWELLFDYAEIARRKQRHGTDPEWIVRRIRCDEPMDMVDPVTVPIPERADEPPWETKARLRAARVAEIADTVIREGAPGTNLGTDFDLEREVLTELWDRWRVATSDGFLSRALTTTGTQPPEGTT